MEELARRFCREAGERSGLRYSQELRRVAMEYARAAEKRGKGRREIAETLGLSEATLSRWQQGDSGAVAFARGRGGRGPGGRQAARERQVEVRRRVTARVDMEHDDAGGAAYQALPEDLARLDGGAVERATKDLRLAEQAVVTIEEQRADDFLIALPVA